MVRTSAWNADLDTLDALQGSRVVVQGRVSSDAVYDDRGQLEYLVDDLIIDGTQTSGRLRVSGFQPSALYRGDEVVVEGKLRSGFGSRQGVISFAEVEVVRAGDSTLESLRREVSAALYSTHTDRDASLALGILIGQRSSIDDGLDDTLRAVGLTRIIAVSGYNLTVLVRFARKRLRWLSKFSGTVLAVALVFIFLSIAGNQASIVRAAWVAGLSLGAGYFGRSIRPIVLLLLSAAATAFIDPFYVWFDLGWWLSFVAFYGVLMVAPQMNQRIFGTPKPGMWPETATESIAATAATLPLILWIFGQLSSVSLLSNMIVVPAIPFVMLISALSAVGYMALGAVGVVTIISNVSGMLLGSIVWLSEQLAKLPFVTIAVDLSTAGMVILYVILIGATVVLHRKSPLTSPYNLLD